MPVLPPPSFSADVSHALGRTIVSLRGELDSATAVLLREKLAELLATGEADVLLDLRDLDFVDSTGISALLWGAKRCRERGGDLTLSAPTQAVMRVFEIAGIAEVVTITRV